MASIAFAMRTSSLLVASTLLAAPLGGCFAVPYAMQQDYLKPVPAGPVSRDAAVHALGVPAQNVVEVEGVVASTAHRVHVEGGTCLDLGIAADAGDSTFVKVAPSSANRYPAALIVDVSGSTAQIAVCADTTGTFDLLFVSRRTSVRGGLVQNDRARYAVASRRRPEAPVEREIRWRRDRAELEAAGVRAVRTR